MSVLANKGIAKVCKEAIENIPGKLGTVGTAIKDIGTRNLGLSDDAERVVSTKIDRLIADQGKVMHYKIPSTVTQNDITLQGYRLGFINRSGKDTRIEEFLVDPFRTIRVG